MLIFSFVIYAFALLLAVDYRFCRHRRVFQQGFRVQFPARCCCVYATACFCFAVVPAARRDVDVQLRHICFRLATCI